MKLRQPVGHERLLQRDLVILVAHPVQERQPPLRLRRIQVEERVQDPGPRRLPVPEPPRKLPQAPRAAVPPIEHHRQARSPAPPGPRRTCNASAPGPPATERSRGTAGCGPDAARPGSRTPCRHAAAPAAAPPPATARPTRNAAAPQIDQVVSPNLPLRRRQLPRRRVVAAIQPPRQHLREVRPHQPEHRVIDEQAVAPRAPDGAGCREAMPASPSRHARETRDRLQPLRSTSSCLISPIAWAGFRPFGQVCVQFMIVWQRYSLYGSSSASSRSPVASSRLSAIQR